MTSEDRNTDQGNQDVVTNTSTTNVGHAGANDEDPTGAKSAGGLVNSDIDTDNSDEGNPPIATAAHRE